MRFLISLYYQVVCTLMYGPKRSIRQRLRLLQRRIEKRTGWGWGYYRTPRKDSFIFILRIGAGVQNFTEFEFAVLGHNFYAGRFGK